jgi:hypothetical protein
MKIRILFAIPALLLALLNRHATAACPPLPTGPAPAVPDGDTATAETMMAAQEAVTAYVIAIEDFLDCRSGRRFPYVMHDDLVTRAEMASDRYNTELRKFRVREEEAVASN